MGKCRHTLTLIFLFISALEVYFWVVVYSFYRDLKDGGAGANIGMSKV